MRLFSNMINLITFTKTLVKVTQFIKTKFKNKNASIDYVIMSILFDLEHNFVLWLTKVFITAQKIFCPVGVAQWLSVNR